MARKRGFLLIECCVYIALCAILTITLMRWIVQMMLESEKHMHIIQKNMNIALVHDVLMRDIQSAAGYSSAWSIKPNAMVWKNDNTTAIGWYVDHGRLVRKEGAYDQARNKWSKHQTSTIAYNVHVFKIRADNHEQKIIGIEITLGMENSEPDTRYIRLRNGRVL